MGAPRSAVARSTGDPLIALTEQQKAFVEGVLVGMPQTTAARNAGYAAPSVEGTRLMQNPKVIEALQYLQRKYEKASQMTRKKVMDGMLEAIELAKIQGEAGVMVAGWREVGRMCGFYAAEKKEINVNITAQRAVDQLETLSDAELLEMIEGDTEAIEAEFSEVIEATQTAADAHYEAAGFDQTP